LILRQALLRGKPCPVAKTGTAQNCASGHTRLQKVATGDHDTVIPCLINMRLREYVVFKKPPQIYISAGVLWILVSD
jgi:hypothetical protein